ncbi:NUDIX domain-containing protein [Hoeflea alexandrii]|uniref:NUDIX domain-containing protein n=1 Tax=Hoeflea alexandrii TaxID=288436 RepID=UPI003CCD140E
MRQENRMNTHPIIIPAIAGDGSLYPVEKLKAHVDGLFHLAISIFVFDGEHLLIQKRASSKYHCGGLWANTCCSHPYWDEPIDRCARRAVARRAGLQCAAVAQACGRVFGRCRQWPARAREGHHVYRQRGPHIGRAPARSARGRRDALDQQGRAACGDCPAARELHPLVPDLCRALSRSCLLSCRQP